VRAIAIILMLLAGSAAAQPKIVSVPAAAEAAAPLFTREQVAQLVAPVALYPDPLLAQLLIAATYPAELVEADRWRRLPANAGLKGDPLAAALAQQRWDPSVKSLAVLPPLLHGLADNLDWLEALGDAFLAQPAMVMDTVQTLRQLARASTALVSGPQQNVARRDGMIVIEPADPQIVFVPSYNADLVYGVWPWPDNPPDNLWQTPWPQFAIGFPIAAHVVGPLWGWCHWDWVGHRLSIDTGRFNAINVGRPPVTAGVWQHNPADRRGVPYADAKPPQGAQPFRGYGVTAAPQSAAASPPAVEVLRGSEPQVTVLHGTPPPEGPRSVAPPAPRPAVAPAVPRVFESFDRGSQVRIEEARAAASRAVPVASPAREVGGDIGGGERRR
jgi:Protein of unknown function (DUF3300)